MKSTAKKPTNYLGSHAERLTNFKLPHQSQLEQLRYLTDLIKQAWQSLLPPELLETLLVITDNGQSLTVSTSHYTFANHLTYSQQPLLAELHQFEPSLQRVVQLKFRVIEPITPLQKTDLQSNHNVTNVTSCELSDFTKQNIAQVIELVTDDIPLQRVLQKFLKP